MNKIWHIAVGAIIVAGLVGFTLWVTGSGNQPSASQPDGQNVGLPVAGSVGNTTTDVNGSTTATSEAVMSIAGAGGGVVETNNILADPAVVKDPINSGYYYIGYHVNEGVPDTTATNNPPYVITYIGATQYFNIALLQEPIGTVREEMEQYLMTHLGIPQSQMCRLNYMVSVPDYINSFYSGKNLGFSFCPDATVLPK